MPSSLIEAGVEDEALARAVICRALARGLRGSSPSDRKRLPELAASAALQAAAQVLDHASETSELLPAVSRLIELTSMSEQDLADACAPLFGHARGEVSPYETDYGAPGAYQQPHQMADVTGFYLAFGVTPRARVDQRADHVACECEFLELLARKEAFLLAGGGADLSDDARRETLDAVRTAARSFLREHLGRFGRAVATRLTRQPEALPAAVGELLLAFLDRECRRLGVPPRTGGSRAAPARPRRRAGGVRRGLLRAGGRARGRADRVRSPSAMSGSPERAEPRYPVSYEAALVEEAVLRAETRLKGEERRTFRSERDRIYQDPDPDQRELRFEELHGRWFQWLGLDRPLHRALSEEPELLRRSRACRVLRATARREEMADLADEAGCGVPSIVLRLRPESLLDDGRLRALLRDELAHVADLLDPAFGYRREPSPAEGAGGDWRARYRAAWDATVAGRLSRRGLLDPAACESRRGAFLQKFAMLGPRAEEAFTAWFSSVRPTHAAILAFARDPRLPAAASRS
jgi:TorA maturation chaperone TorD